MRVKDATLLPFAAIVEGEGVTGELGRVPAKAPATTRSWRPRAAGLNPALEWKTSRPNQPAEYSRAASRDQGYGRIAPLDARAVRWRFFALRVTEDGEVLEPNGLLVVKSAEGSSYSLTAAPWGVLATYLGANVLSTVRLAARP